MEDVAVHPLLVLLDLVVRDLSPAGVEARTGQSIATYTDNFVVDVVPAIVVDQHSAQHPLGLVFLLQGGLAPDELRVLDVEAVPQLHLLELGSSLVLPLRVLLH